MKVEFRKSFAQDLRSIKNRKVKQRIEAVIKSTEEAKSLTDLHQLKKLQGYSGFYRIRIGDYRLGIYVEDDVIAFVRVLHRKEIYRYFP